MKKLILLLFIPLVSFGQELNKPVPANINILSSETNLRDAHIIVLNSITVKGNSKYKLKEYKGAMEEYNKAIEIDSNYAFAYNNRGNIKYILKDYKGAVEDYNKAKELDSFLTNYNYLTYYNRANAKYNLNDYNGALDDYAKAINIIDIIFQQEKGKNTVSMGALERTGILSKIYYYRSIIKHSIGDYIGACQDANKATLDNTQKYISEFCN